MRACVFTGMQEVANFPIHSCKILNYLIFYCDKMQYKIYYINLFNSAVGIVEDSHCSPCEYRIQWL